MLLEQPVWLHRLPKATINPDSIGAFGGLRHNWEAWQVGLEHIQSQRWIDGNLNDFQRIMLAGNNFKWCYTCHYIIKHDWDNRHLMPRLGPKIQKALNIMSEPWRQIALLAKKCHPMPQGRSYVDEVNWFVMITEETRDPMYVIEAGQAETADPFLSKGALVKSLRAHLHQLKQGKSPEKTGSALGALYEASIRLVG